MMIAYATNSNIQFQQEKTTSNVISTMKKILTIVKTLEIYNRTI